MAGWKQVAVKQPAAAPMPAAVAQTAPVQSDTVAMVSPDGSLQQVRSNQAGVLAALGYKYDTPELAQQRSDQEKYGGTLGEIASGALGFARGASLGLSDYAIKKGEEVGALPAGATEATRKLRDINPDSAMVGELASFALPAIGGIKALGTAGKIANTIGAAQGAVSTVGNAAGKVVGKLAGEAVGRVAAPAAKLAVESALFQAAHNISENSLANKDLTVESVLADTGEAALLGAGIGAGLPLALRAGKAAATAALESKPVEWVVGNAGKKFAEFLDPQRAAQLYSGAMSKGDLLMDTPKGNKFKDSVKHLWDEGAYARGDVAMSPSGKLVQTAEGKLPSQADMLERVNKLQEQAGTRIGEVLNEADDAARAAGFQPKALSWSTEDAKKFGADLAKLRRSQQISGSAADRLQETYNEIVNGINKAGSLKQLHEIRQGLDARIGGRNFEKIETSAEIDLIKDIRRKLSDKIREGFGEIESKGLAQGLADTWNNTNKLYSSLATVGEKLDWQVARGTANVNVGGLRWRDLMAASIGGAAAGPLGIAVGVGNHLLQTDTGLLMRAQLGDKLHTLGWLTKATDAAKKNIAKSLAGFVRGVDTRAIESAVVRGTGTESVRAAELARLASGERITPGVVSTPEQRTNDANEWFSQTRKALEGFASDPHGFANKQSEQLAGMATHAPQISSAIVQKQLQVYQYLLEQMPKNPTNPMSLQKSEWKPPQYQIERFRDVVKVAQQPMSALIDMKQGTITRDQVKALNTLYPSLYQQMYNTVLDEVSRPKAKALPYESRLKLGKLFPGVEQSMSPQFIAGMQNVSREQQQQSSGSSGGYRAAGVKPSTTSAQRYATKTETLAGR